MSQQNRRARKEKNNTVVNFALCVCTIIKRGSGPVTRQHAFSRHSCQSRSTFICLFFRVPRGAVKFCSMTRERVRVLSQACKSPAAYLKESKRHTGRSTTFVCKSPACICVSLERSLHTAQLSRRPSSLNGTADVISSVTESTLML